MGKKKREPNPNDVNIDIDLNASLIPMYQDTLEDVLDHKHTHYALKGGRGSTKSSAISIFIILVIMSFPNVHAVIFRKIGNTIKTSVWSQIVWAIYQLGLQDLFTIPKTYSNPIVFKPTGQQIIFFGLDDPNKVKSVKLPFGYIGITWFEELDQYNGQNEIRKVLQSTMRGGELFWDFRSFNPPISINNWANELVADMEKEPDWLIIGNTYLNVPKQWLGEQFIAEAELLKKINPKAYEHEYLGIPVGTGGNVFYNVEDLNMDQLVDVADPFTGNIVKTPMWQTFSNIYCGIDWGFAIDPFRFVRMHFDSARRDLYIFGEYSTRETSNLAAYETLIEKGLLANDQLVTADSAEPKSIGDFKNYGAFIRPAEKGPDSVRYGIKWLQALRHIYIDRRKCPYTYKEFVGYEYAKNRDDEWISEYPDENNHSIDAVRYALERFYKRRGN